MPSSSSCTLLLSSCTQSFVHLARDPEKCIKSTSQEYRCTLNRNISHIMTSSSYSYCITQDVTLPLPFLLPSWQWRQRRTPHVHQTLLSPVQTSVLLSGFEWSSFRRQSRVVWAGATECLAQACTWNSQPLSVWPQSLTSSKKDTNMLETQGSNIMCTVLTKISVRS